MNSTSRIFAGFDDLVIFHRSDRFCLTNYLGQLFDSDTTKSTDGLPGNSVSHVTTRLDRFTQSLRTDRYSQSLPFSIRHDVRLLFADVL